MKVLQFEAFHIAQELQLNNIAESLNIKKKFTWEEALIIKASQLTSILNKEVTDDQKVLLFSFGSVVFINIDANNYPLILNYLRTFDNELNSLKFNDYSDYYELHVDETSTFSLDDEYMIVTEYRDWMSEIISTVIAKSVAFERIENKLSLLLDSVESTIDELDKGKYSMNSKKLAKQIASILRHDYNSLVYVMILDRPDITWDNSDSMHLYDKLSQFFELNDRHMVVKEKMETLNRIMNGFIEIATSNRAYKQELTIILLIAFEIILSFFR